MTNRLLRTAWVSGLALLGATACDYDIQNPNSPDPLGPNPTRARVANAATGLLIGEVVYYPGWILNTSIIGRDGYRFDGSEPRYTSEALTGQLDAGGFIGGSQWLPPYRNIRGANALLTYAPTSAELTAEEISAVSGFARTIQALDFLNVVVAHTQDSIPIDVGTSPTGPPAPFVTQAAAYDHIERLLDSAQTDLQNGGSAFPFDLSAGYGDFSSPTGFIQFNRALRARVDVYRQNWAQALVDLSASFVDTLASLDLGAYHLFSIGAGDATNPLNSNTVENFAHPQLRDSAQLQPGGQRDLRFLTKTRDRTSQTTSDLTSDLGWNRYPGPTSPIPIIRNEELILIRAEANIQQNNLTAALADLNFVRVNSGGLAPLAAFADQAAAINALLYERRYSLVFEWGHRWIDMRRYNRLNQLPIDRPGDVVYATLPIPTDEVLPR